MIQEKSTGKGIGKRFAGYTLPAITGMVVSSLYTVVDGIFVGRGVGEMALASVNIVYPFIMFQIAVAMLVAMGGANLFSICRGQGKKGEANNLFCLSLALLCGASLVVNLLAIAFSTPLCRLLGADDQLLAGAREYLFYIALFGLPYMPALSLSIFIRNDGAPRLEMVGTLCGAVTNIFLDWLFIMVFGWGLAGAAIATGIGQLVSAAIWASHLLRKKATLKLRRPRFEKRTTGRLLYNGLPSFLMEFSQSAVALSFNTVLMAQVGAAGVSAYSVVMYICSIFNMVLIGVTQGAQPILSFSHGAGEEGDKKAVYRLGIGTALGLTALFYGIIWLFGRPLTGLFLPPDSAVADMAVEMMRLYFLGFFPVGISLMNILWFQASRQEVPSIVLSALRCLGFVQLFLVVLPGVLGLTGIYLAFLCGEGCNCLLGVAVRHRRQRAARAQNPSAAAQKAV